MLWMEVLPFLRSAKSTEKSDKSPSGTTIGVKVALGIVLLMWWMLLMTAAFFHTWTEKLLGLVVALSGVWLIYFFPRISEGARQVLGVPGAL